MSLFFQLKSTYGDSDYFIVGHNYSIFVDVLICLSFDALILNIHLR